MFDLLSYFTGTAIDSTLLLFLAIAVGAVFFEDATTVVVGVLAADGLISIPVAALALYSGICVGDLALYTLGAYARTHPRFAHYIDHDFTAPFRSWLFEHSAFKVFVAHFVPGLRFTTYAASGFFRLPLSTYLPMAFVGGVTLMTALFTLSYWFGSFTSKWVGEMRWGVAGVVLILLFIIAKRGAAIYRSQKVMRQADVSADIHTE